MVSFTFFVEGTPVPKARSRVTVQGGRIRSYTPKASRDWEEVVGVAARQAVQRMPAVQDHPVAVHIRFFFHPPKSWSEKKRKEHHGWPAHGRADIDNLAKSVLDGLQGIAYRNDRQVYELFVSKRWALGSEGVSITVRKGMESFPALGNERQLVEEVGSG